MFYILIVVVLVSSFSSVVECPCRMDAEVFCALLAWGWLSVPGSHENSYGGTVQVVQQQVHM